MSNEWVRVGQPVLMSDILSVHSHISSPVLATPPCSWYSRVSEWVVEQRRMTKEIVRNRESKQKQRPAVGSGTVIDCAFTAISDDSCGGQD